MSRSNRLVILGAMAAALVLPVAPAGAATTSVDYDVAGTASASLFPQVSLTGVAVSGARTEAGVWKAVFSQDLGAILGGTFTFRSRVRSLDDTIAAGTFGGGFGSPPSGTCARTTIPIHGVLGGGGSFDVTLTRYGSVRDGSCVVSFSTVLGTATLVFAP